MIDVEALEKDLRENLANEAGFGVAFAPEISSAQLLEIVLRLRKAEKELLRYQSAESQRRNLRDWEES